MKMCSVDKPGHQRPSSLLSLFAVLEIKFLSSGSRNYTKTLQKNDVPVANLTFFCLNI